MGVTIGGLHNPSKDHPQFARQLTQEGPAELPHVARRVANEGLSLLHGRRAPRDPVPAIVPHPPFGRLVVRLGALGRDPRANESRRRVRLRRKRRLRRFRRDGECSTDGQVPGERHRLVARCRRRGSGCLLVRGIFGDAKAAALNEKAILARAKVNAERFGDVFYAIHILLGEHGARTTGSEDTRAIHVLSAEHCAEATGSEDTRATRGQRARAKAGQEQPCKAKP